MAKQEWKNDNRYAQTGIFNHVDWKDKKEDTRIFKASLLNSNGIRLAIHKQESSSTSFEKKANVAVFIKDDLYASFYELLHLAAHNLGSNKPFHYALDEDSGLKGEVGLVYQNTNDVKYVVFYIKDKDGNKDKVYLSHAQLVKDISNKTSVGGTYASNKIGAFCDILRSIIDNSSIRLENHYKKYFESGDVAKKVANDQNDSSEKPKAKDDDDEFPF